MNNKVSCTHCTDRVTIPDSRPEYRNSTAAVTCKLQGWIFYGRGKGLCPACNLLDTPVPLEKIGEGAL